MRQGADTTVRHSKTAVTAIMNELKIRARSRTRIRVRVRLRTRTLM